MLSACAPKREERVQQVKRIAVVPVLGDRLELARIGKVAFAHKRAQIDISAWRLKSEIYDATRELLDEEGRYTVSRLDVSPAEQPALHAAVGLGAYRSLPARKELAALAARCGGCDALLLIADDRRPIDLHSSQYLGGFTWVAGGGVAGNGVSACSAVVALRAVLVDARDQKVLGERRNDEEQAARGLPARATDTRWWPIEMDGIERDQREQVKPVFVDLMRQTIRRAVHGTGLLPSCTPRYEQARHAETAA